MSGGLIVLDIGSTLVEGPPRGPAARLADAIGLAGPERCALRHALMTTDLVDPEAAYDLVRERFGRSGDSVWAAVARIWDAQQTEARPIPGAAEALKRLVARGHRLALLSNIWTPYLRSALEHFGEFFNAHIPQELQLFSCREGLAKPAPELFSRVLVRAGARADEAVMVGDSYAKDIEPATAAGMRTLWLLHEPVRETPYLVSVLNGSAPLPTLTLRSLADMDVDGSWLPRGRTNSVE